MRGKWERRIEIDKEREREKERNRQTGKYREEGGGDYIDHVWTGCL